MANYSIEEIHKTFERLFGESIDIADLEAEINKQEWIPDSGQMVVIGNKESTLQSSTLYGTFIKYENKAFETTAGTAKFARPLTTDEISACYRPT